MNILKYFVMLCCLITGVTVQHTKAKQPSTILTPMFELDDSTFSNSGSVKLTWNLPDSINLNKYSFELEQSLDANFDSMKILYAGPDLASYISGLPNGNYHYRVRAIIGADTSTWSNTIVFSVEHHSLELAFLLFCIGAIVFLATVVVVIKGTRNQDLPAHTTANLQQGGK